MSVISRRCTRRVAGVSSHVKARHAFVIRRVWGRLTRVARHVDSSMSPMRLGEYVLCAALLVPSLASAEAIRPRKASGTADYGDVVAGPATINDLQFARQVLPPNGGLGGSAPPVAA